MTDLLSELEAVVRLAEKADQGCWRAWAMQLRSGPADDADLDKSYRIADLDKSHRIADFAGARTFNLDFVQALVKLFRTHHAEIAAAVRDAKRWRYVVENSEWIRDEEDTLMAVRFEDARPNLESIGMRTDAIDTAMRAGEGEG